MVINKKITQMVGFTLLEMTVVMALMGILASVAIGSYIVSQQKGRDAQRKSDLAQVQRALEAYVADYGVYPAAASNRIAACGVSGSEICSWGGEFEDKNGTMYMKQLPQDPAENQVYIYGISSDQKKYQIFALLENKNDPTLGSYSQTCSTDAKACNYGVASSNATPGETLP